MFKDESGLIENFDWGVYQIRGKTYGKDVRIVGSEASKWKERKGHELTSDMITGIDGRDVEVLIIGNGVNEQLHCPESIRKAVLKMGIKDLIVLPTPDACRLYNELYSKGTRTAMLAHGTC